MREEQKVKIDYLHKPKIILIGNPNVGKSVVFNNLTGKYVTVSNYPGTTIDVSHGSMFYADQEYVVVDTPGTNSLIPKSEDELVTRNILLQEESAALVQVADAKNLERSLLLTFQLLSLGLPIVLDLNMSDEAKERGYRIDTKKIAQLLDIILVSTVAITGEGIGSLKEAVIKSRPSKKNITYSREIEAAFGEIQRLLPKETRYPHWIALMLLTEDAEVYNVLPRDLVPRLQKTAAGVKARFNQPVEISILEEIHRQVAEIITACFHRDALKPRTVRERIGALALKPLTGIPVMLLVIWIMYEFVGRFAAGTAVDFLKNIVFDSWILPRVNYIITGFVPWPFFRDLLVGQYGLISMALTYALAIILPIVGAFFIFFGLLEDSGYLPRLTVLSDRIFKVIGLNGKAILPMILGLGCGTMAVLTSRILDTRKERLLIALLLALGVPCSAQLGVVLGMVGGISGKAITIWFLSIIASLVLVGLVSNRVIPGRCSLFIQEIPPIRWPKFSNILVKTWARLRWYLVEAVPLFAIGTLVLFILDKTKILSLLEEIGRPVVVSMLGLSAKAAGAFLIGFLRRDYGAAGLYVMQKQGLLNNQQVVVSMVVITLFVPCLAQALVTYREFGWKKASAIMIFVTLYAVLGGTVLNYLLNTGIVRI
ncbi:MAG: ferrous iron transport protein B [Elusimicrobia bacterium]|nr:ferrous iron transport protein B [Elusimicrobiota bacterium]